MMSDGYTETWKKKKKRKQKKTEDMILVVCSMLSAPCHIWTANTQLQEFVLYPP